MNSLHEFLDEQEGTEKESFAVKGDSQANWALRKIKQMNDQIEQNNALAQAEIDKIEQWNQSENEKAQSSIDYFQDRKSTRLNSSHVAISYAVYCLKKE